MVMEESYRTLLLKFDDDYQCARKVYFTEHKTSTPSVHKPLGRTLFVTCIPPWATADNLRDIFSENGPIQSVYVEKKPNPGPSDYETEGLSRLLYQLPDNRVGFGFKFGYVVFKSASGMRNALKVMDLSTPRVACNANNITSVGIVKWKEEYNNSIIKESEIPQLQSEIKEFTENFDREKDEIVRKAEEEAEPDDEGWVTVSRHTSKKPVVTRSLKAQTRLKAVAERKRKNKELANFYKFQMKEEKLKRIDDLKSKFEADKQKQLKMKQDRKFKPF